MDVQMVEAAEYWLSRDASLMLDRPPYRSVFWPESALSRLISQNLSSSFFNARGARKSAPGETQ
jgi:hypothetical protein